MAQQNRHVFSAVLATCSWVTAPTSKYFKYIKEFYVLFSRFELAHFYVLMSDALHSRCAYLVYAKTLLTPPISTASTFACSFVGIHLDDCYQYEQMADEHLSSIKSITYHPSKSCATKNPPFATSGGPKLVAALRGEKTNIYNILYYIIYIYVTSVTSRMSYSPSWKSRVNFRDQNSIRFFRKGELSKTLVTLVAVEKWRTSLLIISRGYKKNSATNLRVATGSNW
jgi:hypothetical protein